MCRLDIIQAIVSSNTTRKDFIAEQSLKGNCRIDGLFRLVMKEGSDNLRSPAFQGVMKRIKSIVIKVVVYEPEMDDREFFGPG